MQQVLDYLAENEARFVIELCEYMRFPSVSGQSKHKEDLHACAEWLVNHCLQIGLKTRLCPTAGNPVVIAQTPKIKSSSKPHYLVYGHYDVQPAEPLDLWKTPPFEPHIKGRFLFGRGASDNKGQHFAHLKAVEAYLKTGTELPCDITFIIEGEEETGSMNFSPFLKENRATLCCDAVVISDNDLPDLKHPALTYGLRGVVAFEIKLSGPARDLHSGIFGGSVENPAMALCQMLAQLRNNDGHIAIPGFYDVIVPLTDYERQQLARIPFNAAEYRKFLGVPKLFGEHGFTPDEQRRARPTFEINSLTSGYQGQATKTIVPAWARAKITCRLVPDQKPAEILKIVSDYIAKICPPTVRLDIEGGHGAEAYFVSPTSAQARAALRALEGAFGCKPVLLRDGGSIPIVNDLKKILGADSLMLGLALPSDDAHSPNENFSLEAFAIGMKMSAQLWQELSESSLAVVGAIQEGDCIG